MRKMNKIVEKVANVSLNILIGIFAVILLVFFYSGFQVKILKNDYANFFGYSMFEVQTGSMKSYINAGDWIVLKLTKDVNTNDVITFKQDGNYITHRVIEIYNGTYITKGDANNSKDDPIDQSQIVGKVVKVLGGFGILRKTIFNPAVVIALIITLLLFNLTFKNDVESMKKKKQIRKIVNKIINLFKNLKKDEFSDLDEFETPKKVERKEEKIIEKEPIFEEKEEPKTEEALSKTSMFRVVSVKKEGYEPKESSKVEEETEDEEEIIEPKKTPEQIEEELSKTSMFRIIKADTSDVDKKIKKIIKKEQKENKDNNVYTVTLEAEKVVKKLDKNMGKNEKNTKSEPINVNVNNLKIKTYNTKAKNIIDKAIKVKKQEINQIMDIILEGQKTYVIKSSFRNDFIDTYISSKYYLAESAKSNTSIKEAITELAEKLTKKNIRDEKQRLIIKTYEDLILLYSSLDKSSYDESDRAVFYQKTLRKYSNWDLEYINYLVYNIIEIQNKCLEEMEASYKKLETDTFEITFNKITNKKDLYSVVLNHNISFSSVYSDYIVDKTYNEGIVSEDKVVVLLTLLSSRIAKDIMSYDYNKKYIIYIPNGLYEKEKKMAGLLKLIEDDYAKNHIYILLDTKTLISNKKITTSLKKQGYNFAFLMNEEIKANEKSLGYLYLADYIFVDKDIKNISSLMSEVPEELLDKIVKENVKKLGDFGGK